MKFLYEIIGVVVVAIPFVALVVSMIREPRKADSYSILKSNI